MATGSLKMIPADVRVAYKTAFGVAHEARFRLPAGTRAGDAKQCFRDWDAEVTSRIERLRAEARGEGLPSLTQRQAHALAGRWYTWFIEQHEENPGRPDDWALYAERYDAACSGSDNRLDEREGPQPERGPKARRRIQEALRSLGWVPAFLDGQGVAMSEDAEASFLDAMEAEFVAAMKLLSRRAGGDYRRDKRPKRFPELGPEVANSAAPQRLNERNEENATDAPTLTGILEGWWREAQAAGRKPSTYESYSNTTAALVAFLGHDDAHKVTPDDIVRFKDHRLSSVNPRTGKPISAKTVKDSDLSGLKTLFGWAVSNRKLPSNPATGITIKLGKPPKLRGKGFTEDEVKALLSAALHVKRGGESPQGNRPKMRVTSGGEAESVAIL